MVNARDDQGNVLYRTAEDRVIDEVWRIPIPEREGDLPLSFVE